MRRFSIGLAVIIAMLMVFTAVAAAAPPGVCDPDSTHYNPDHPSCSSVTTTTEPAPEPQIGACPDSFTIAGTGRLGFECLWTPENDGSTVGTVTVTPTSGSVSSLVVFVRDSAPGDICHLSQGWEGVPGSEYEAQFDLAYSDLTEEYAAWDGHTYWSFGGTNWCAPRDPVTGPRTDLNGEPLHLAVNFRAKKGTEVAVSLQPVPVSP